MKNPLRSLNLLNWAQKPLERSYRDVAAVGGMNSDWGLFTSGEDADVWQNIFTLRARMRDLWKTNPYFSKYRELLAANIFGEQGIMLRMKIKETEDRVVTSSKERWALLEYEKRRDEIRLWAQRRAGKRFPKYRILHEDEETRKATIKVGDPDVYANLLIERRWKEWQRAEFCDALGRRPYNALRQIRLWSCARDGDHFVRLIRDKSVNKFGLTLQHINAEWCDYFYNDTLRNGNEIRMGIEYAPKSWGLGPPVAYHFIKRMPKDWQFSAPGGGGTQSPMHERIDAREIIHYARFTDADGTRPAPWGASTIVKSRGLDQFELAEVFAARASACKTGWLTSSMVPEGGMSVALPDPTSAVRSIRVEPGGLYGLPWGVDIKENNPTHPNGNFEDFRKGMLRSWCAGMPVADYNVIANDLENINFSAGRLGRLDTNEMAKLIQCFDIDVAERPIFEAWLEMSLMTGAIPLPLVKFDKFNQPNFQGRRWAQVDEIKAETASSMRIANNKSSWSMECDMDGVDFDEMAMQKAQDLMLLENLGLDPTLTAQKTPAANEETPTEDETPAQKPASNGNGKHAPEPRITF